MEREYKFRFWLKAEKEMFYNGFAMKNKRLSENENNICMQYTGIKDFEGVEIYEDDIVKKEYTCDAKSFTGRVKFYEGAYWIDNGKESVLLFSEIDELHVLGNVHEN